MYVFLLLPISGLVLLVVMPTYTAIATGACLVLACTLVLAREYKWPKNSIVIFSLLLSASALFFLGSAQAEFLARNPQKKTLYSQNVVWVGSVLFAGSDAIFIREEGTNRLLVVKLDSGIFLDLGKSFAQSDFCQQNRWLRMLRSYFRVDCPPKRI